MTRKEAVRHLGARVRLVSDSIGTRRKVAWNSTDLAAVKALLPETIVEPRPFAKGESVYILWPERTHPEGTTCPEARVWEDDGRDGFVLLSDMRYVEGDRVRRDRRGKQPPAHAEVPPRRAR